MRGTGLLAIAALAACDFPRPADVGDGGVGDGRQGDGSNNGASLGPFATFGAGLAHARAYHAHAVIGTHLSLFGGIDDGGLFPTSIEQASIGGNDTLGAFALNATGVVEAELGPTVVTLGNEVFVIGGESGTMLASNDSVQHAPINPSGSFGTFSFASPTLVTARDTHGLVLTNKFVYVFGGEHVSSSPYQLLASVERASITSGTIGAFSTVSGVSLTTTRAEFATVQTASFVYVIGGVATGIGSTTLERAPINADGTLGTFTALASHLVTGRRSPAAVVLDGAIYVIGGRADNLDALDTIERAVINGDGTLGPFATLSVKLVMARYGASADVIGSSIYVAGGSFTGDNVTTTVERAIYQ